MNRFLMKALAGLFAAASAAFAAAGAMDRSAPLAPGVTARYPEAACTPALEARELVTIETPFRSAALEFAASCEKGAVTLVALVPPGVPLIRMRLEKGVLAEERLLSVKMPQGGHFMTSFLLSRLPLAAWRGRLPRGWTMADEGRERIVREPSGEAAIRITYSEGPEEPESAVLIENLLYGYKASVRRLSR